MKIRQPPIAIYLTAVPPLGRQHVGQQTRCFLGYGPLPLEDEPARMAHVILRRPSMGLA